MRGQTLQVRVLGGMAQDLPQPAEGASLIENWTVDPRTQGISTRIGYEKYRPLASAGYAPFGSTPRVDSLFVAQGSVNGARQTILFEAGGVLYLYNEVGQENDLISLTNMVPPTATDMPTMYTQWQDRVIVTNGRDAPKILSLWPMGATADVTDAVKASMIRPLGFSGQPSSPDPLKVVTIDATGGGASSDSYTGASTTNWYPVYGNAISFPGAFGMGQHKGGTDGVENNYQFKVAFVSDTGSVSPLSEPCEVDWEIPASNAGFRYCPTIRIPLGPPGTVARRVYGTFDDGQDFYFIADVRNNVETLFHAFRRSSTLSTPAPDVTETAVFPAPYARFAAVYKQCLFLDGGRNNGTTLYFSKPGLPDQFGVFDNLTLTGEGGDVVGLYSHYNNLIIFRESSIDVLTGSYPNFSVQTITKRVACIAPASVEAVPGLGVVFLAIDGVHVLTGGLDGGSVFDVRPIGLPIRREFERLTLECATRAVGRYAPRQREYHLYIPVDGNDRPNLGVIFHIEKGWSVRTGFPVGCIDRTFNGALVFGHNVGATGANDDPAGLFVISGTPAMGGTIDGDTYTPAGPPTSKYQSPWMDFGDAQVKKQVQYVVLWCMTRGNLTIDFRYYKDFEYSQTGTDTRFKFQSPDQSDQPVYDSAVIGTDEWQEARLVPIRLPVALQSCSWFKWELETTDDVTLVGYEIEYVARGTVTVAGKLA